jgi:hypothetical protein
MKRALLSAVLLTAAAGCLHVAPDGRLERWAAGRTVWSVVIPGTGQFMNGEYGKGALMLGLSLANNIGTGTWEEDAEGGREFVWASDEARARYAIFLVGLGTWSGMDAYKVTMMQNETAPVRLGAASAEAGPASDFDEPGRASPADGKTPPVLVLDPLGGKLSATLCYQF